MAPKLANGPKAQAVITNTYYAHPNDGWVMWITKMGKASKRRWSGTNGEASRIAARLNRAPGHYSDTGKGVGRAVFRWEPKEIMTKKKFPAMRKDGRPLLRHNGDPVMRARGTGKFEVSYIGHLFFF